MRSGTNWVSALLNLHPDINCVGEGPLGHICSTVEAVKKLDYLYTSREPHCTALDEAFYEMSRRVVLSLTCCKPSAAWVGDNTSRQFWMYLPDSSNFYILRDGRDVLTSWTFHQLRIDFAIGEPYRSRMAPLLERFRSDRDYFKAHPEELLSDERWVRDTARYWKAFHRTGQEAMARIERGEMPIRVCPLRYEGLVADAEGQRQRMYRFLELDPALAEPLSAESKTAAGFTEGKADSFYRSGKIGDWKNYANDNFRRWFKEEAGEALIEAGYEQNTNW